MAMSGTVLGTEIANIITDSEASDEMKAQITRIWQQIGDAIVNHITTCGVVSVTVATTGTSAAQSGTGTGSIS